MNRQVSIKQQQQVLQQFRLSVSDCDVEKKDDDFFIPWLAARDFNVSKAEKMLRESLRWREEWYADDISAWKPPEVCLKYFPLGYLGYDKEGCPVWLSQVGKIDPWGFHRSINPEDFFRYTIQFLEKSREDMETQSKRLKKTIRSQIFIGDMEGLNMSQILCRPGMQMVIRLVIMFEHNYPEELKACYIINAPRIFTIAFSMIKPFLSDKTQRKIFVFGFDRGEWIPEILQAVDETVLPLHWGGTRVDDNKDPKCSSFIVEGGEIPRHYYMDNKLKPSSSEETIGVVVGNGEQLQLKYYVRHKKSSLHYEFWTEDHDISFGVKFTPSWGIKQLIPQERINSNEEVIKGVIICEDIGEYVMTFDNSYSKFRSKQLYYSVTIVTPNSDIKQQSNISNNH